jgi:Alanyl-tRNA synthetase
MRESTPTIPWRWQKRGDGAAHLARGVPARIASLMEERKKLERDLSDARKKLAMGGGGSVAGGTAAAASGVREVGNVKLMARSVENIEMKDLKSLADDGKKQLGSGVVAIVGVTGDGKAGVVVGVTSDLTSRFNAVDLARVASQVLGGKGGGGRPTWRKPVGPMAPRQGLRSRPSKKRWRARKCGGDPPAQKAAERPQSAGSPLRSA